MKKSNLIYLLLFTVFFTSCDTDKFNHFGVGNTFEKTFTVALPADATDNSFSGTVSFSAADDATIEDNLPNITDFNVTRVSLKINSFNGASGTIGNGTARATANSVELSSINLVDLDFAAMAQSGEELILPLNQQDIIAINNAYLAGQTIDFTASGSVNKKGFTVEFSMFVSIEATINNN